MTLHVTNGDILADRLKSIGVDGYILPWREVLHEGTLTDYQSVDRKGRTAFNQNRATDLASKGWISAQDAVEAMNKRDAVLLDPHWKEIVLWLENDLFDQLILAQVLTLLSRSDRFAHVDVRLVETTKHLNYLRDSELLRAGHTPRAFTQESIAPYLMFWVEVTHGNRSGISATDPKPLQIARRQWLELQPGEDGLSAFDKRVLDLVQRRGTIKVDTLFQQINAEDGDAAFWADLPFTSRVEDLAQRVDRLHIHNNIVEYAS